MNLFQSIERLARAGHEHAATAWDARRLAMVNGLCLLSLLLSWLSLPAAVMDSQLEAIPLNLMSQLVMVLVIWLNRRGQSLLATSIFCGLAHLAVSGQVYFLGPESGVHAWFIPLTIIPLYVFPAKSSRIAVAFSLVIFLSFLAVSVTFELQRDSGMSFVWAQTLALLALVALGVQSRRTTLTAEGRVDEEQARADALLHNMLPASIVKRLLRGERPADRHPNVTVLFADLVHFTELAQSLPADQVVRILDRIFSAFDQLVEEEGLEKIKTIGDAYMVASGIPEHRGDHAQAAARLALAMRETVQTIEASEQLGLSIRVGMNCGPVVAGVIGRRRYAYDLWSDVVNVAARMEQSGQPGGIQITAPLAERLRGEFQLQERGSLEVKGKGSMETWWLEPLGSSALAAAAERSDRAGGAPL